MKHQTRAKRNNSIITVIGHKGDGKTTLTEILMLLNNKPKIIADPRGQYPTLPCRRLLFSSPKKLILFLSDNDNFKLLYKHKLELVVSCDDGNFETLAMIIAQMRSVCFCVDEIDMFFQTSATAKNPMYKIVHYGRHNEIDLISTSRRPANISRNLTSQTDTFYFSRLNEPNDLKYLKEVTANETIIKTVQNLEKYNFLKLKENGIYSIVKTSESDINIIDSL